MRELLGGALVIIQAAMLMPLIVHALRTRSAEGVALSGEAIWAVAGLGWASYALQTGDATVVASGLLAAIGSGLLTILLWPNARPAQRRTAAALATVTAIGLGVSAAFGSSGLAAGLSVFGVVQFWPQSWTSIQALRTGRMTLGVSRWGAGLRAAYTTGWALYAGAWFWWGISASDIAWPLVAWGLMGLLAFGAQALAAGGSRQALPA